MALTGVWRFVFAITTICVGAAQLDYYEIEPVPDRWAYVGEAHHANITSPVVIWDDGQGEQSATASAIASLSLVWDITG